MSLYSEYMELRKKRIKEETEEIKANNRKNNNKKTASNKTGSNSSRVKTTTKSSSSLFDDYLSLRERRVFENSDIAPVSERVRRTVTTDIAPAKEKEEDKWFKKGLFEDGYDFGDITKTILGTGADIAEDIGTGIIGMGEKALDALATIAPYAENAQFLQNGGYYNVELQKQHDKAMEQSKTELAKFVEKDLYDEEKIAKKIVGGISGGYDYEGSSVLGAKADSVVQSGGQLLGTLGLQAVGVPWFLTTGATAFGSEAENAFNQGATFEEATLSSAIAAGAEVLTEKISGGIKFGGKAIDDALTQQIARGISNKFVRGLAKLGLDAAGEGAEEWITEDINKFGQWLTYRDEEELKELLFSEEAMDEKIDAFIGGSLLGGVSNVGNAIKSKVEGVDYASGLTKNEEAVVKKVYDDLVAEAEKNGKVSQKEKSKIYDDVLNQMDKGYISIDTIEEVLGGDTYKSYKNTVDSEDSILKEYEELGKKQNATLAEQDRYSELKQQVSDIKKLSNRDALKHQLSDEVFGLAQGSRLAESYNEKARKGQAFEADLSQYTKEQQNTIQKAIDSGILNNSNRTHEFVDVIAKISADKGVPFDFANNAKIKETGFAVEGKTVNGYVTKDGITINIDSPKAWQSTVGHEITHVLEGTEFYDSLKQTIFDYAKSKGEYDSRLKSLTELYKNVEDADVEGELTADLVGDYLFQDADFVNRLSTENRNVFQKIYDEIKYLCKVVTAGSKEARELEKVKKAFDDAYRAGGKQADTQYSLSEADDNAYFDAVGNSDWETAERMVEEAAKKAGYTKAVYHGTDARFTVFDTDEESTAREEHAWMADYPDGTIFLAEDYDVADGYGDRVMELYLDTTDMKVFEEPDMYAHRAMDDMYGYEVYNYPVIAVKGKDMTIYATLDNTLVKSSDTVTTDDDGAIIPLSERFKHSNPDVRFSLSDAVEETKDLMAIHNLHSSEVLKQLKMGGMPYPSVAITKPGMISHDNFGEVSIVLKKDAIDPKKSKYNKIYSADAYTPTFPNVEYEASEQVAANITSKVNELYDKLPEYYQRSVRALRDYTNIDDQLNRWGGEQRLAEKYADDYGMKQLYLAEKGEAVPVEKKSKETRMTDYQMKLYQTVSTKMGEDVLKSFNEKGSYEKLGLARMAWLEKYGDALKDIYAEDWSSDGTMTKEEALEIANEQKPIYWKGEIDRALDFIKTGGMTVTETDDIGTTQAKIDEKIVGSDYKQWVDNLFSGIEGRSGIRNSKDIFTPSGNRRSFAQTHDPLTVDNIVKAMRKENQTGQGAFGGGSILGASAKEFGSIAEVKRNAGKLGMMGKAEHDAITDKINDTFWDIAKRYANGKDIIDAQEAIVEAVSKNESKAGIARYLKQYDYVYNYTDSIGDEIIELRDYIRSLPTPYFEAKPRRGVGFDEVAVFVIPYDADVKLKQELLNRGYPIAEYDPKVEGDRQRVLNQFEEYKFSLSDVGEAPEHGRFSTPAKDLRLEIAPVAEKTQLTEEKSTPNSTVSETESVEEMFPDDAKHIEEEYESLVAERDDILGAMDAYAAVGDVAGVDQFMAEYESINARIAEIERDEVDRLASLEEADAPPEMEAPVYGEAESASNPFADRDWYEVGKNRSSQAFMREHPEFKPFFQEEALNMLGDLGDSQKGERWYNDELYYKSGFEKGFGGQKRFTSQDIEQMLDQWGMTYEQITEGLTAIAEDNDNVNKAAAKRIEFMLNQRLMTGYKDFHTNRQVEPNQAYLDVVREWQHNQQSSENFDSFMATADQYAPMEETAEDIAPVLKPATPDTQKTPVYESKEPGAVRGQTSMFAPEPPRPGRANILTEEPKTEKRKSKAWSWAKEHLLDNGMVFEDLSKQTGNRRLEAKWNFIRNSTARAQRLIGKGARNVKSLNEIRKQVEKSGKTELFYDYLYHKHNMARMTLADRFDGVPNKAVFGDSVTANISRREVQNYEAQNPDFKYWAQDVYNYMNHLRGLLVENGVISQETANLWQKMYPHYVPIRRAGDNGLNINVPLDTNRTGVNAPIKRATGGSRDILPLFDTMAMRTEQTYKAIAKNSFGIELKNMLGSEVSNKAQTVDGVIDSLDSDEALLKRGENGMNPTFSIFENGERVEFEITEEMYEAMKPKSDIMSYRNKVLNGISNFRRGTLTEYNPWFLLKNAIKDQQDIIINSQHPLRTYANMPVAIGQMVSNGEYYQEYLESGGEQNTYFDTESNTFKENKVLEAVKWATGLNEIAWANNKIEMLPRLAEYIASRKAGRSVEVSMLDAARVTTNFAAGGDVTKLVNRNGATFLNASVQGAVQQARNIREAKMNGLKGWAGLAARYLVAGLPVVLLNNLIWEDDEEYEELSDYVKRDYYVVAKFGDGQFLRIPKGRTVAVLQNAFEQMDNLRTGDDDLDLKAFLELAVSNLAPNNPLENNVLSPIIQVAQNKTWYGEDLVPSRLQDVPAAEQYDESTDDISRWLGEKLDYSPVKINYLLDQYSGVLGDTFLPMMTPKAESGDDSKIGKITAPLRDMFTTDSVIKNQTVGDFYDLKDQVDITANSSKATEEDKMKSMYMDAVGWELSDLYKQKREIQNSDMADSAKYKQSRDIQKQINEIMENAMGGYNNVSITGLYSEVGDKRFNQDSESGKWYEIKAKNSDGSDNWYYQKEQEVTKGLGISYEEYWNNREEYNYAYDNPEKYTFSKAVGGYQSFRSYTSDLWDIKADKDENGKSINGSRKTKVIDYINNMDADYGEKIVLFKSEYNADDTYNYDIIEYLNGRDDISYSEMETILKYLGFDVDSNGNITW